MDRVVPIPGAWDNIPAELKALRQWVCYRIEERHGKPTKIPYRTDRAGRGNAKSNDSSTWHTYEEVVEAFGKPRNRFDGIGFVLSESDPYVFIDLDHVVSDAGDIQPWARELIERIQSYTELSQSGTGIHIIARAKKPGPRCRTHERPQFEIYDDVRLVVFTGGLLPGASAQISGAQQAVREVYFEVFGDNPRNVPPKETARNVRPVGMSDPVLIEKALSAQNGEKFERLWHGNAGEYDDDASAADMALCCMLAYWADRDPVRIDRLFRESGLMRDKWDELRGPQTYGQITIDAAIGMTRETHADHIGGRRGKQGPQRHGSPDPAESPNGPDGDPLNDLGNARRLVKRHGEAIRYCSAGSWYAWAGTHWADDETGDLSRYAKTVVDQMLAQAQAMVKEASRSGDEEALELARLYERHALASGNHARLTAMIAEAQSEPGIPIRYSEMDKDDWSLNCANGTVDLRTGELRPHSRDELITKVSDVAYDLAAPCPTWERFISEVFQGDADLIRFIQAAAGYTLTGDTREQVFFILHGCGSNGKSTFITALREIFGDYHQKTSTDTIIEKKSNGPSNDIAALRGSRFVSAIETSAGRRLAEALVKELTGQDAITARFLYEEYFTFTPKFKLWLACNHVPTIAGQDEGIWRRIRLIPFNVQFHDAQESSTGPYKDKDLPDKLRAEYPGILAWAVRGSMDWHENGLPIPRAVMGATTSLRQDMDVLGGFLSERCVFDSTAQATAKELYAAYCEWTEANGEKPLSQRWFGLRLGERGTCKSVRTKTGKSWHGIGLVSSHQGTAQTADDAEPVYLMNDGPLVPEKSLYARTGAREESLPQTGSQGALGTSTPRTITLADGTEFAIPEDDDLDWSNGEGF